MKLSNVRVVTKSGTIANRKAIVTEWIDGNGRVHATAITPGGRYMTVVGRDFYGPLYANERSI